MTIWERIKASKNYILALLSEQSTWRGIMFFVAMFVSKLGYEMTDEMAVYVSVACSYTLGILFTDDFLKNKEGK